MQLPGDFALPLQPGVVSPHLLRIPFTVVCRSLICGLCPRHVAAVRLSSFDAGRRPGHTSARRTHQASDCRGRSRQPCGALAACLVIFLSPPGCTLGPRGSDRGSAAGSLQEPAGRGVHAGLGVTAAGDWRRIDWRRIACIRSQQPVRPAARTLHHSFSLPPRTICTTLYMTPAPRRRRRYAGAQRRGAAAGRVTRPPRPTAQHTACATAHGF